MRMPTKINWAIHLFTLFSAITIHGPAEAQGCLFDQMFIGQIKRAMQNSVATDIGNPDTSVNIQSKTVRVNTTNGIEQIRGFRVLSLSDSLPRGYILALPGNAQRARELIAKLIPLAASGYDILAFDYRGLLEGESVPTIESLISDTKNLVIHLNAEDRYAKGRHIIYGVSTGGIFALQAIPLLRVNDLVILDSVPDKLPSLLWCDQTIHPLNALNADNRRVVSINILNGAKDNKVVPRNSVGLINTIERRGGSAVVLRNGSHPYEVDDDIKDRLSQITKFVSR